MNDYDASELAYKRGYSDGRRDGYKEAEEKHAKVVDAIRRLEIIRNCDNCGKRDSCEFRAKLWEYDRINCPLWENEDESN